MNSQNDLVFATVTTKYVISAGWFLSMRPTFSRLYVRSSLLYQNLVIPTSFPLNLS